MSDPTSPSGPEEPAVDPADGAADDIDAADADTSDPIEPSKIIRPRPAEGEGDLGDSFDEVLGKLRATVATGIGKAKDQLSDAAQDGGALDGARDNINETLDGLGSKISDALANDKVDETLTNIQETLNKILGGAKDRIDTAVSEGKVENAIDNTQSVVTDLIEALKKRLK